VIVESLPRPGYSQVSQYISELGVGPCEALQNANLIIIGILSIVFALGLERALPSASCTTARRTRDALTIFRISITLAGVFLLFVAVEPTGDAIPLYYAHTAASFGAFLSIIAALASF
jgi:hypothetical membrane protein